MHHWKARRYLASIPDASLPPQLEMRVLAHARACARCRRHLDEYFATERLIRQLPAALLPPAWSRAAEGRLAGLIRWAPPPAPRPVGRWRAPVLGVAAAIVAVMLQLSIVLPPAARHHDAAADSGWMVVASVPSDHSLAGTIRGWR